MWVRGLWENENLFQGKQGDKCQVFRGTKTILGNIKTFFYFWGTE